jgi:hypothetical protein
MSRWWRAYDEALNDPKLQELGLEMVGAWFNLLCVASQNGGRIESKTIPFRLRVSEKKARGIVGKLVEAGLLEAADGGNFTPHNWAGRQYASDHSIVRVEKYRSKRRAAGLPILGDYSCFKAELIERDGNHCVYCESSERLVVDHMRPIALGGTDDINNLALACKRCNSGKAGRTPELARMIFRSKSAAAAYSKYCIDTVTNGKFDTVTKVSAVTPDTDSETEKKGRGNGSLPTDDWRARRDRKHEALAAFKKFVNTPVPDEGSGRG